MSLTANPADTTPYSFEYINNNHGYGDRVMKFRKSPLALAITVALSCSAMDTMALPAPLPIARYSQPAPSGFDDSHVTVISDDWDSVDDGTSDEAYFMDDDPFAIEALGDARISQVAAYGDPYGPSDPCYGAGTAKIIVNPIPANGVIYGGGGYGGTLNCGKKVPAGAYGERVCTVTLCKNTKIKLQAIPNDGYRFTTWGNGCAKSKSNPYCTGTLKANTRVSAGFKRKGK